MSFCTHNLSPNRTVYVKCVRAVKIFIFVRFLSYLRFVHTVSFSIRGIHANFEIIIVLFSHTPYIYIYLSDRQIVGFFAREKFHFPDASVSVHINYHFQGH